MTKIKSSVFGCVIMIVTIVLALNSYVLFQKTFVVHRTFDLYI
jgi:hypothetical protein